MTDAARRDLHSYLLSIGLDIMVSQVNPQTNTITVQLGDASGQQYVDTEAAEIWQQSGFTSRPAAPTPGAPSCQALAVRHSAYDMVFAQRDTRWASINADIQPGDACLHATGPLAKANNGRVVTRASGQVEIYATGCTVIVSPTGTITVNGSLVKLGSAPTSQVVLQDLLAPQLTAFAAVIGAIQAWIANITATSPGPASAAAPTGPLNAAVIAALTNLTAALALPNSSQTCTASH